MTPKTRYHVSNLLCPRGGTRTKRTASMLLTYDRSNETRRIRQNVSPTLRLLQTAMETHHDVLNVAQIRLRLTQGVRRRSLDVLLHQRLQLRLKVVLEAVRLGRVDLGRGEASAELRKCASGGEGGRSETRLGRTRSR